MEGRKEGKKRERGKEGGKNEMILGPVIPLQKLTVRRLWQTQLSVIFSLWFSKEKKKSPFQIQRILHFVLSLPTQNSAWVSYMACAALKGRPQNPSPKNESIPNKPLQCHLKAQESHWLNNYRKPSKFPAAPLTSLTQLQEWLCSQTIKAVL